MAKYTPSKSTRSSYDKWSTGYYGQTKGTKFEQSSFWMEDNYLSNLLAENKGDHDIVRLASYQRSIGNFVKILTGRDDIKVRFHQKGDSYTDNKTVTISSKLDAKNFDATVGLALHEGSHCLLTDFNARQRYSTKMEGAGTPIKNVPLFLSLTNMIEDRRIDYYVMQNAPGYQGYYKSFYEEYFTSKAVDKALRDNTACQERISHYEFHICNFMNPNRNLDALKYLRKIWKMYDLGNIGRLKNTMEVCELAHKIHDVILAAVKEAKQDQKNQEQKEQKQDQKTFDDNTTDGDQEQESPTQGGSGDEDEEDESDDNDMGGSDSSEDSEPGDDDNSDDEQDLNDDGDSGSDEDGEPAYGHDPLKDDRSLAKAIAAQKEFTEGKLSKKSLAEKIADMVNKADEADVDIKEVGDNKIEVIIAKGINSSIISSGIVDHMYRAPMSWETKNKSDSQIAVEEGWQLGTLLGRKLKTRDEERSLKSTRLKTGKIDNRLMAELGFGNTQVFSQTVHYTVTPCTLHLSLDASGSMGGRKWAAAIKTATAIAKACSMISNIRVVIDLRGTGTTHSGKSNSGRALVWVVYDSKKDTLDVVRKHFANLYAGGSTPEGLCFDAIMKYIVDNAKGKDAYFINVSDGEPAFSGYYGHQAEEHTKKQVMKMRSANINVLSYFASDYDKDRAMHSNSWTAFQRMYGKDSTLIDLNDFNALSKSLNALFERGVGA